MSPLDLEIFIPGQPVAKGRPRVTARGGKPRTFTPAKTRAYEGEIAHEARLVMGTEFPVEGPLRLTVTALLSIPKSWSKKKQAAALAGEVCPVSRPDVDNYAKSALDGLNEIVFRDDSQVADLIAIKRYSESPGLRIRVQRIGGDL